ncbi:MAG: hypothetical protein ACI8X3_003327, partial [Saprospiraceae bacterium]
ERNHHKYSFFTSFSFSGLNRTLAIFRKIIGIVMFEVWLANNSSKNKDFVKYWILN